VADHRGDVGIAEHSGEGGMPNGRGLPSVDGAKPPPSTTCTRLVVTGSVTARLPKDNKTNSIAGATNSPATNTLATTTNSNSLSETNGLRVDKKKEGPKQIDVVFVMDGDHVKMVPVKIGISDDNYWEVTEGLTDGQEVVSGGYHAISHDLEDGKKVVKGKATPADTEKKAL